jgi:hypothetical protein
MVSAKRRLSNAQCAFVQAPGRGVLARLHEHVAKIDGNRRNVRVIRAYGLLPCGKRLLEDGAGSPVIVSRRQKGRQIAQCVSDSGMSRTVTALAKPDQTDEELRICLSDIRGAKHVLECPE